MQRAQLRPASVCGGPTRMQPLASRRRSSCVRCQQQHNSAPEHEESQQVLLSIGRKVAAMTAAAMLMVRPSAYNASVNIFTLAEHRRVFDRWNQLVLDRVSL